ncbi:Glucose-1-phosphate adenylyltransferase [Paraliobacillus sp. PM-2]|uniref:glucose-1-phosphate adenylyltransferase n=1 Tax=Paraliobacillus sp. PM-2 TaxID=1462524 RepID=UPI00061BAEF0|nr:glucose-1-phosphate adenylyltransferase [Paraliobacillus sp. PM-2]CQR47117.1 Glucose-1-phosphate adenylyltransferase [Paraliobacillus sp. PM-2]
MKKKECVAMILAGGQGTRLQSLTYDIAKPAVFYGGKYRIIDFTLSNCTNSGIDTVGVLTQYEPHVLNDYIGIGSAWDLDRNFGGVSLLPPYMQSKGGDWYKGTADAIYQNIKYLDYYQPEHVLILSGDHIYKMDYARMLEFHQSSQADATISVIKVPLDEANRFGIMDTDEVGRIVDFEEKPSNPKNNLASMGVYIFRYDVLKDYLLSDASDPQSSHDFGKDIIPTMLKDEKQLMSYTFDGYWKDVGTIQSLWQANMDLLEDTTQLDLHEHTWRIYSNNPSLPAQLIGKSATVKNALIGEKCHIYGEVDHSVLFYGVDVAKDAVITDSIIMPNVSIGQGVRIHRAIVMEGSIIKDNSVIGNLSDDEEISVYVGSNKNKDPHYVTMMK